MSKLKYIIPILAVIAIVTVFIWKSKNTSHEQHHDHLINIDPIWGKSRGPILVRIKEIKKSSDSIIVLEGLIKSNLEQVQVEWKLPEGAVLLEGKAEDILSDKAADGNFVSQQITVDVSQAKDTPIFFTAYIPKEGERIGQTRAYKWNITEAEKEHVEEIRARMKAKKVRAIR